MHKSKLGGFIIDCHTGDLPEAAAFWSGALGMPPSVPADGDNDAYRKLQDEQHGLNIEVQKVEHPSRVHLDIETDDVEAEVHRLETLGATKVQQIRTWWVMQAPTGQRFCVVRAASPGFDQHATQWP